jgi:formylmethanofuran--tetrahydromethanopterin N-formyltransferase
VPAATAAACCLRPACRGAFDALHGIAIDDGFAEAFPMKCTRLLITAHDLVVGAACGGQRHRHGDLGDRLRCEAGIEREPVAAGDTGRTAGRGILLFAVSGKELAKQVERRVGQCVADLPTTAVFAGLSEGEDIVPRGATCASSATAGRPRS